MATEAGQEAAHEDDRSAAPTRTPTDGSPNRPTFEDLYAQHWTRYCGLARLLTDSASLGEEIAQDVFLELSRRWADVEEPLAYVRASVVHAAKSYHRRQFVRRRQPVDRIAVVPPPEIDEMWTAISALSAPERAVVVLRFYEDLPLADIATVTGCPLGTVKSQLHRALARLRRELS